MNDKWYPIELKYKHKKCKNINITRKLVYNLENHSCETNHREKYCKDIMRLLDLCKSNLKFEEGYAILLTNYEEFRYKDKGHQKKWLLYTENIKNGVAEINKNYNNRMYDMKWYDYNIQNDEKFSYLITTIKFHSK